MFLWLAACTIVADVDVPGESPVAEILEPVGIAAVAPGPAAFLGRVRDAVDPAERLFASWDLQAPAGWERVCSAFAEPDGTTRCVADVRGPHTAVRLVVRDVAGFRGTNLVPFTVAEQAAPLVTVLSPRAPGPWFEGEIPVEIVVDDEDDGAAAVRVSLVDNLDGAVPFPSTPDASGRLAGRITLSEGDHALEVVAVDPGGVRTVVVSRFLVRGPNAAPFVRIVKPTEGAAQLPGEPWSFAGVAIDEIAAPPDVAVTLASDLDGDLGPLSVEADGRARATLQLSPGLHTLTFTGTDPWGLSALTTAQVVVDSPPVVTVTAPEEGATYALGEQVVTIVDVADSVTPGDGIDVTLVSSIDGPRWLRTAADGHLVVATYLSPGEHRLAIAAKDSYQLVSVVEITVTVNP